MNKLMRSFREEIPFAYAACICGLVIIANFIRNERGLPPGFIAFFCFLPAAFYFAAQSTRHQISTLEKRIGDLEEKLQKN